MKLYKRPIAALLAVMMLITLGLTGCSASKPTSTPSATDAKGGKTEKDYSSVVVNYGLTTAWDSLNPYGSASGSVYQHLVLDSLYDRLAFVRQSGVKIEPRAAKSWKNSDDGMSATFYLDPNAKWHDGQPVTAEDWVWTAKTVTNPSFEFGMKSELNFLAGTDDTGNCANPDKLGIEAVDKNTLVMRFKAVTPVEDWILLHNKYFYVLPKHLLKDTPVAELKASKFWAKPVGSGPCTFISELTGSQLSLGSFHDYQLGAPKFGKLVYTVISPSNTVSSMMAGELDAFVNGATYDECQAAATAGYKIEKSELPSGVVVFLINDKKISDKRIRQAMSYAIDKKTLLDQAFKGNGLTSATCIVPGSEWDVAGIKWEMNVDKAKQLLADAGWDSNKELVLAVTSARESAAAIIQQNLAKIGMKVKVTTVDLATEFAGLKDGKYDLGICGTGAMNYPIWMQGYYDYRNATYCSITDPTYANMQTAISSELNKDTRKKLVKDYQEYLYDQMPLVILYHSYSFNIQPKRLQNFSFFDTTMVNQAIWEWTVAG